MPPKDTSGLVAAFDTNYGHYEIYETIYGGRPARVLYSGQYQAAQSGIPKDGKPELLFDYNQRFYELVTSCLPKRLLLIGGGMFTLPMALLPRVPGLTIWAVELDAEMVPIAKSHFGLIDYLRLNIVTGDGLAFLEATTDRYDMIVLDAFDHAAMPPAFGSAAAIASYYQHLAPQGVLAVNVIAGYYGQAAGPLIKLQAALKNRFNSVDIFPAAYDISGWQLQNLIVVAQKGKPRDVSRYLRYAPIKAMPVRPRTSNT